MILWNFDLLWKNYGTMEKTMVLWKKYYGTIVNYSSYIYSPYSDVILLVVLLLEF